MTEEEKNLGGRPPNPKLNFEAKEFDLVKWVAERYHAKDPGAFIKTVVMNFCKNYYLEQKKLAQEKAEQKELAKEIDTAKIINEIEEEGGIDRVRKYVRDHKKIVDDDMPPVMEGQIEPMEEEDGVSE